MKNINIKLTSFYIILTFYFYIVISLFVNSTNPNIITLNYNLTLKNQLNDLAPQGWAFFTKDIHKDYFNIYSIKNKKIFPIQLKSADLTQIFGLCRSNRAIHHKITTIISYINNDLWVKYKGDVTSINIDKLSKVSINVANLIIYGCYVIEYGEPKPYEWMRSKIKTHLTMKYIILEIKPCK